MYACVYSYKCMHILYTTKIKSSYTCTVIFTYAYLYTFIYNYTCMYAYREKLHNKYFIT